MRTLLFVLPRFVQPKVLSGSNWFVTAGVVALPESQSVYCSFVRGPPNKSWLGEALLALHDLESHQAEATSWISFCSFRPWPCKNENQHLFRLSHQRDKYQHLRHRPSHKHYWTTTSLYRIRLRVRTFCVVLFQFTVIEEFSLIKFEGFFVYTNFFFVQFIYFVFFVRRTAFETTSFRWWLVSSSTSPSSVIAVVFCT